MRLSSEIYNLLQQNFSNRVGANNYTHRRHTMRRDVDDGIGAVLRQAKCKTLDGNTWARASCKQIYTHTRMYVP